MSGLNGYAHPVRTRAESAPSPDRYVMGWEEVFQRFRTYIYPHLSAESLVYGVPRGGTFVAAMTHCATADPESATLVVDDIVDSGVTARQYQAKYRATFAALVDKQRNREDRRMPFVVFPWETATNEGSAEENFRRILQAIGEDPDRDGLLETPARVVRMLQEMTSGTHDDASAYLSRTFVDDCDQMVVVKDIPIWSLCEHHLLPFHGRAHVAYIPQKGRVVGLSKIARTVSAFARRLQIQERLTRQIADAMMAHLDPLGVAVCVEAFHTCMAARGARAGGLTVTNEMKGVFRSDQAVRSEFLSTIRAPATCGPLA